MGRRRYGIKQEAVIWTLSGWEMPSGRNEKSLAREEDAPGS